MADLTNLPDFQKYELGRGTSDSPQIHLYQGPSLTVAEPLTGITLSFIVYKTLLDEAANVNPALDPNVLLYYTSGAGIVVVDNAGGIAQLNIPETATYDPNDPTVAAKFQTDQPYPYVLLASNPSGQNRPIARGLFYVRAL